MPHHIKEYLMTKLILALVAVAGLDLFAALPPYYARNAQIQAILSDAKVAQEIQPSFGRFPSVASGFIDSIIYQGPDRRGQHFLVHTGKCRLSVTVVSSPPPRRMVGPSVLTVLSGQLDCRQ